jgi:uncharacterized protein YuzE
MRVTLDKSVDAAFIYLTDDKIDFGFMYECDEHVIGDMINLEFAKDGRLVGIEVMGASHRLPGSYLEQAEVIG